MSKYKVLSSLPRLLKVDNDGFKSRQTLPAIIPMKILLLITCFHTTIFCWGQIDKTIYRPYKDTADSIVSLYVGHDTFDKYVRLDSAQSEFLVLKNHWDNKAKFNGDLNFEPNVFEFSYLLTHPGLLGESFNITFMLDSSRH